MNENNINQMPNTENAYPQSGYPQSGYPQSQQPFPQSEMPYPMSGYAEEKKSQTLKIVIIAIVAVLIVALATTLIVVLRNKQQGGMMPPPPPPMETMISISENGSMINGQAATIDFFTEDGKAYLKLEDISSTAGYDFVREGNQVKLLSQLELAIIELGSTKVTLQDQTTKSTTSVEILKAPFEKDGNIYIYARDLSVFLQNTNVSYDSMTGSIVIRIGSGMGGPGGPGGQPPMNGQMPQGGQTQPNVQQQQNAPATEEGKNPEGGKKTDSENKNQSQQSETNKSAAPAQGGQPPQGAPGGQPPQPPQN